MQNHEAEPEQVFFDDPALDRMFGVVMALATEVYVLRDRLQSVEAQLGGDGVLDRELLDAEASLEELAEKATDREAFVRHLMDNLLGQQVSSGGSA